MRSVCAVAGAAFLACCISATAETRVPCDQSLNAPLQSRTLLAIESRPAGLEIVGTDEDAIHISCTAGNQDTAHVVLHFSPTPSGGKLTIEGAHSHHGQNNLQIRIQIPRRTNLRVRMFAGDLKVEEIKGDKDLQLGAGQITITALHQSEYRNIDASVGIGEVRAPAFNTDKGGFFRSLVKTTTDGEYRLRAHVSTGEIDLLGSPEPKGQHTSD
jgi:hypothetical protein